MSLAKKFLSAFIEVEDDKESAEKKAAPSSSSSQKSSGVPSGYSGGGSDKFKQYFNTLFQEANLPGPDYFEFTKMIDAMKTVPEEQQRYIGAFAGLSVQGLDKAKLVASANEYLKILDTDATNFNSTVDAAINEKVQAKKTSLEEKTKRIQDLTREINDLNNQMQLLTAEIKENEEKIKNSSGAYLAELENMKAKINTDISKINKYI
jgi:uncharacterized protein YoxC